MNPDDRIELTDAGRAALGQMTGFGIYQHHEPLCPETSECGWCRRERARNTAERIAIQESLDTRARTKARIIQRAIERNRRKGRG